MSRGKELHNERPAHYVLCPLRQDDRPWPSVSTLIAKRMNRSPMTEQRLVLFEKSTQLPRATRLRLRIELARSVIITGINFALSLIGVAYYYYLISNFIN